ncbi:MAG: GDSL-type esterase/lipase family protein [Pseudomonadota bacterium]
MTGRPRAWAGRRRTWLLGLAAVGLLVGGRSVWLLQQSSRLVQQSQALQARPAGVTQRLLVVGDSTAVGTGASSAAQSLVGLIAAAHPDWQIQNLAANGARFADVALQLAGADAGHDRVLVLAGGNDVIRLTGGAALQADLQRVVALAQQKGRRVVLMPAGSVGHAPFFWPPLSWWMDARSRALHAMVQQVAQARGLVYVRLLQPRHQDPFVQQPALLHAADGLHPSDAGYRLWYAALRRQGGLDG